MGSWGRAPIHGKVVSMAASSAWPWILFASVLGCVASPERRAEILTQKALNRTEFDLACPRAKLVPMVANMRSPAPAQGNATAP